MNTETNLEPTEHEQKIHFWKVAISRGDFDAAKEFYREVKSRVKEIFNIDSNKKGVTEQVNETEKKHRERKAKHYEFPEGEFRVKTLVELFQCSQPNANNIVNAALESGKVVLLRTEKSSAGRGKPARIFSKASVEVVATVAVEPVVEQPVAVVVEQTVEATPENQQIAAV